MLKKILINLLVLLSFSLANKSNEIWTQRQTKTGAVNAYHYFRDVIKHTPTFENYSRFAQSAYFYGDIFVTENAKKREVFKLGREAAAKAISLNNQDAIGYLLYGLNTGKLSKYENSQKRLIYINEIIEAMNKTIELQSTIDSKYNQPGIAYLLRAITYSQAPTPPISIGDEIQAEKDFKKALELEPKNRQAYRFYAQYLLNEQRNIEALKIIEAGLALEYNSAFTINDEIEIDLLKKLKTQL
jgi:tetratricopeptide (TPR) repeat protein